jgi:hypothetical protein
MSVLANLQEVQSPPLVPVVEPIDVAHLSRMTLGEQSLEREVLELFDRQAAMLLTRIRQATPAVARASAHTLKGSALGIGAWRVARAAEAVEHANAAGFNVSLAALDAAVDEAKVAIAGLLRAN